MALDIIVGAIGVAVSYFLWRIDQTLSTLKPPVPDPPPPLPPVESRTAKQRLELNRPHVGVGTFAPTRGFK